MTRMMIARTVGMDIGLTTGVIFGILFSNNFFYATVLAMLVGIVLGFLTGLPVCMMALLDGMLSGLMGGMIGAMIGAMIAEEHREAIVKMMFFLLLGPFMILLRIIDRTVQSKINLHNNLFVVIALFLFFFLDFDILDPIFMYFSIEAELQHS